MAYNQFHFIQGAWLWGLAAIPLAMLVCARFYRAPAQDDLLERFADRHLLPHLIRKRSVPVGNVRRRFLPWALAWACGIVAMAGPSWTYTDQQAFKSAEDLVIVLELSQSMTAQDVKPSRIARAREEIQDLLDLSHGTDIGLIAYAAVPHMVAPLTDDVRTIKNLLPAVDTSLITLQGDRLEPALEMAAKMLKAEPSKSNSILVIGDGGFQENDFAELARATGGASIYTMEIGATAQATRLQKLSQAGHGMYVEADYSDNDTRAILDRINAERGGAQASATSVHVWEDRFYIPLLALLLCLLPLFRKSAAFAVVGILTMTAFPVGHARAATPAELFLNKNQQAMAAFDRRDYKSALAKFDTDYRRGVVAYRAGRYDKAAAFFKVAAKRSNSVNAYYDLGNAQLMQSHPQDAIASYEAVLKQRPGDVPTQHNLAIARKMLEQQQQKPDKDNKSDQNKQHGKKGEQGGQGQQGQQGGAPGQPQTAKEGQQQGKPEQTPQSASQRQQASPAQQSAARENAIPSGRRAEALPDARGASNGRSAGAAMRMQMDAHADEWLNRVQSDPGSFLRNQFIIEERQSSGHR